MIATIVIAGLIAVAAAWAVAKRVQDIKARRCCGCCGGCAGKRGSCKK